MAAARTQLRPGRGWLAVVLAWAAGFADAVGYLALFRVHFGFVTGNSVDMSLHLSRRQWEAAAAHCMPIAAFVVGVVLSGVLDEASTRRGFASRFALQFGLQALLLAVLLVWGQLGGAAAPSDGGLGGERFALLGLAAVALGLQNGAPATCRSTRRTSRAC